MKYFIKNTKYKIQNIISLNLKILALIFFLSFKIFAESGLEIGIFVPLGMSVGINYWDKIPSSYNKNQTNKYNEYVSNNTRNSKAGFEGGLLFQAGYRLEMNKALSFSFMGEIGYSRDTLNYSLKSGNTNSALFSTKESIYYSFDSLVIGFLPKINYKRFSFGIGFGMKAVLGGNINRSSHNTALDYSINKIDIINLKNYKNYFKNNIIPYIKLTFDYSLYTSSKFDFVIGAYLGYDFNLKYYNKKHNLDKALTEYPINNMSGLDIGIQIGTKIRPLN